MANLIAFLIFLVIFVSLGISQLNDLREYIRDERNNSEPARCPIHPKEVNFRCRLCQQRDKRQNAWWKSGKPQWRSNWENGGQPQSREERQWRWLWERQTTLGWD
jgi:hypothetical protein